MTGTNAGIAPASTNFAVPMAITFSAKCRKYSRNYSTPLRRLSLNQNFKLAPDQTSSVADSEIATGDFGHRREVENLVASRRPAAVGYRHIERNLVAFALDLQRPVDAQHISVFAAADARALKMNLRVICDVKKIFRAQMIIAHFDAGRDARGVDRHGDRRMLDVVFVQRYLTAEVGEAAFDLEEQHFGAELHGRILGVNRPNSCGGAVRADCLWLHLTAPS